MATFFLATTFHDMSAFEGPHLRPTCVEALSQALTSLAQLRVRGTFSGIAPEFHLVKILKDMTKRLGPAEGAIGLMTAPVGRADRWPCRGRSQLMNSKSLHSRSLTRPLTLAILTRMSHAAPARISHPTRSSLDLSPSTVTVVASRRLPAASQGLRRPSVGHVSDSGFPAGATLSASMTGARMDWNELQSPASAD